MTHTKLEIKSISATNAYIKFIQNFITEAEAEIAEHAQKVAEFEDNDDHDVEYIEAREALANAEGGLHSFKVILEMLLEAKNEALKEAV